jgi:ceramide glucosyltransferase
MTALIFAAALICALATVIHIASIVMAAMHCRPGRQYLPPPDDAPGVSIVRPVCGFDNFGEQTLRSSFALDYPAYEIIFCIAVEKDPAVAVVRELIAAHPHVSARLLIGNERISANPKLNNCLKGWREATYEWIALVDSNVLMPRDYIQRLTARWRADTGLVSSPAVGSRPCGFWAELECAFLNTYEARWQLAADAVGFGFAQGKTMLWRRSDLERAGGLRTLASEAAEDAVSTKIVRNAGLNVHLADAPFEQPLGARSFAEVWNRQVRRARLRRTTFPLCHLSECATGALPPLAAATYVASACDLPVIGSVGALASVWYGSEAALAALVGWHLPLLYPLHATLRDLLLPALWVSAWAGSGFVWRGNEMTAATEDNVAF